jgi:mercuric ion transport protein
MNPEITLIFDPACPNVHDARDLLRAALERTGIRPRWVEYQFGAGDVPERFRCYGSPTILVDGVDVAGEGEQTAAASCRVYPGVGGFRGVPPLETIVAAITRAIESRT